MRAFWLLCAYVLVGVGQACFQRQYYDAQRIAHSHLFVRDEYEPKLHELHLLASGPVGPKDFVKNPTQLERAIDPDVLFRWESSRRMTKRCREKVELLSLLVRSSWPDDVHLVVLEAWKPPDRLASNPNSVGPIEELHFAGRAVDITLRSRRSRGRSLTSGLGRLAMLASYEAAFDWCVYLANHVHCSVKPDTPHTQRWFGCLHGDVMVTTKTGPKRLRSLHLGEAVLSRGPRDELKFSPVIAFLHRDPSRPLTFLRLQLVANRSLSVTPNHLVFRHKLSGGYEAVFAAELRPGDRLLLLLPSRDLHWVQLLSLQRFEARGAFAPMTETGSLIANDVLVSSYAQIRSHNLAHTAMLPVRIVARVTGPMTANQGLRSYVEWLLWLTENFLPRGTLYGG